MGVGCRGSFLAPIWGGARGVARRVLDLMDIEGVVGLLVALLIVGIMFGFGGLA